jgi:hypothetical protein
MPSRSLRLSLAIFSTLIGCGPAATPTPSLAISRELTTLKQGATAEIKVSARDAEFDPVDFGVSGGSSCLTYSRTGDSITLTAGMSPCAAELTIEAASTGLIQTVQVNVIDPLVMDIGNGLLIRYVNAYQWRWNDSGSGASQDTSFWHPVAPAGYFPLGSVIRGNYEDLNVSKNAPAIVVKDFNANGALAAPTGYEQIWNDGGSGASNDGSVWRPLCPEGYAALGVVTQAGYATPSTDDIRCVKNSYTVVGSIGPEITNDSGSGAGADLGVFGIAPPVALAGNDGRVPFTVGASLACSGYNPQVNCAGQSSSIHVLMLPIPITDLTGNEDIEPRLSGHQPLDVSIPRFFSSMRMPFTLIPAAATTNVDFQVKESPFYNVYRTESYSTLPDGVVDNRQGSNTVRKLFQVQTGLSTTETETFTQEVGIKVSAGGSAGFLANGRLS